MKNSKPTFEDLRNSVDELRESYPQYRDDDLFVLWFLRAYVTDRDEAAQAITGGARDKGIDALLIDDVSKSISIVQGKYRHKLDGKVETRNDVLALAHLASVLHSTDDEAFQKFIEDTDDAVAERLRTARKKVQTGSYRTSLYFVTTARVSPTAVRDVEQQVRHGSPQARVEVIDGRQTMHILSDYLDGVAPPIPSLELEMEAGDTAVSYRFDRRSKVESWVFPMRGDKVAELYERTGRRLFARNIRGFLGIKTPINEGMKQTLKDEPDRFFYYNNGITIVCDEAERKGSQGKNSLHVGNPQIINGQQTTRTLAEFPQHAARASVLVKVIRVPRDLDSDQGTFENLVSRVVRGTNWQNAIKAADLITNDRRQVDLERSLRKVGYCYLRRRQSKGEAKATIGRGHIGVVSKEELAQAVAGCNLDPVIIRSGRDNLFREEYYDEVFPNSDPDYFLPRYWLMRAVTYAARRSPFRGYAKWLVLNFLWSHLSPEIRGRQRSRAFRRMSEKAAESLMTPLHQAVNSTYNEALRYFRKNRGVGKSALDPSLFFKNRKDHHLRFAEFWHATAATSHKRFSGYIAKLRDAVESFDE